MVGRLGDGDESRRQLDLFNRPQPAEPSPGSKARIRRPRPRSRKFGSATYALIGATSPTDRAGHSGGTLNNASLTADFTHQTVDASLNLTVNSVNVIANGTGSIGASAGLPAHQFTGAITSGSISGSGTTPQGSFSGFFSAPARPLSRVSRAAVGLSYTITDGHALTSQTAPPRSAAISRATNVSSSA